MTEAEWEAQLQAAKEAHERRTLSLMSRGWQRPDSYTRGDVQDWLIDRELRKINARRT